MIKLLAAIFFAAVLYAKADTQPRGADRLRELVVFPKMSVTFDFGMGSQGNDWAVNKNVDLPGEISRLRGELKQQPDDIKQLLQLGILLDSNDQTNEAQSYYRKAEQLCRDKAAVNPQNGLNLTDLGEALRQLDKHDEAESVYRKATLVSSNEWRCWVELGNFLASEHYFLLFPKNLRSQIVPTHAPSQGVLDYRPSADALAKSEAFCNEASRCFDRAMALAPKEPEVFFQRAGYMSVSNWQNCFFQYYRGNQKFDSVAWISAFMSKETIANLKKAADLSPQNYDYISLAAYFEWFGAWIQGNPNDYTPDMLPDATRRSIHDAMARLLTLSQSSDKKLAAGALENLGILNMFIFRDSQATTAYFRQAVSQDPTREQSWDMLLGSIAESGSPEEKVAVCEARLKQKNSARNHLLLARAFQYQKKWDRAGEQAEAALKIDTNNIVAHVELLALALKKTGDTSSMAKAFEQFTRTEAAYEKLPDSTEKQSRWRELTLNLVILDGLVNTPAYQKAARTSVDAVLQHFPDDKQAREISSAL